MPQLRRNPVTGEWVVIAPERSKRPADFAAPAPPVRPTHGVCTFCVGGSVYQEQVAGYETDQLYLVKNKFPAFVENMSNISDRSFPVKHRFYQARPAIGAHDVVVVKDGDLSLPMFPPPLWRELLTCFQGRAIASQRYLDAAVTVPIYNHGEAAGASIQHPHAQLFSPSIVPPQLQRELRGSFRSFEQHSRCVFCDLVQHEREYESRIIAENNTFVAFTFYSSRFPFETWILPKGHHDRFETAQPDLIEDLAHLLPLVLQRIDITLRNPPLNLWIHSLPTTLDQAAYFHWHLEIAPRVSTYGGFELGAGMVIDMVSPEQAAAFLRGAKEPY